MKLYTKRGDDGGTDLFGGQRVPKESLRVTAYGTVDELNCALGLAAVACQHDDLRAMIDVLQHRLFELGADLATPRKSIDDVKPIGNIQRIGGERVSEIESMIDKVCEPLPQMRSFILPGGTELSARLHLSRAICRRAEREATALARIEPVGEAVTIYLNRLSDLLFAMARRANQLDNIEDVPWNPHP